MSARGDQETIDNLLEFLRLRAQNGFKLHLKEQGKMGNLIKVGDKKFTISDHDTHKNELIKQLKNVG